MTVESALLGAGLLRLPGILAYIAFWTVRQLRGGEPVARSSEGSSTTTDRVATGHRVDLDCFRLRGRSTPRTTLVFELLFIALVVVLLIIGIIEFSGRLGQ